MQRKDEARLQGNHKKQLLMKRESGSNKIDCIKGEMRYETKNTKKGKALPKNQNVVV
jgi:hypothetical protein